VRVVSLLVLLACAPAMACAAARAPSYQAQVINPDLAGGLQLPGAPTLLLWGSDATILRSQNGAAWTHADTAGDADLNAIGSNADGSVLIAVGLRGVVLRSVDRGLTWEPARNPDAADLKTVSFHAPSGTWIAAGAQGHILRSIDGGKSFKPLPSTLTTDLLTSFVDPKTQRLLVGGDGGVVGISRDGGESWDVTKISMPDPATPVASFRRFGTLLVATSALGRFLLSSDDATSWDLLQAESKAFWTSAAFDPGRNSIVLVGHNGDVLRSTDQGASWQLGAVESNGHRSFLTAVDYDPRSASLLAVGEGGTVVRSVDGGADWQPASGDVSEGLKGLLTTPDRLVSFGAGGLVVSSTDSGARWAHARPALEYPLREVVAGPGGALLAGGALGTLLRSTDGGRNWSTLPVEWPNANTPPDLRVLLPNPAGDAFVAAGPPGAILRSNADATTWRLAHWSDIAEERAFPWMLADGARNLLVAVESRGLFQVSRDGGVGWTPVQVETPANEFAFWQGAVHAPTGTLLVAGKGGLAVRSTDGARSWSRVDTGTTKDLYGSFAAERGEVMFLMGQGGTLLRSEDLGAHWQSVPSDSGLELRRMVREPRTRALICFGAHGAIIRSTDEGRGWHAVASNTDGVLRKALFEPETRNLLLVGGQGTLRRSADGGRSWQTLPAHTSRHFVSAVAVPGSGDLVLVGDRIVRLVRRSN